MGMTFVRLFIVPLITTFSELLFSENNDTRSLIIFFCVTFTLNWFADKTIIQWCINRGKELTRREEEKKSLK